MSPISCPLLWSSGASKPSCWCEPWSSSTPALPSCQSICSWCSQRSSLLKCSPGSPDVQQGQGLGIRGRSSWCHQAAVKGFLRNLAWLQPGWQRWLSKLASIGKELQLPVVLEPLPWDVPLPCKAKGPVLLCDPLPASLGTRARTAGSAPGAVDKEFRGTLLIENPANAS